MHKVCILGVATLCALPFANMARAEGIAIDHKPVGCMVAGKFPRLEARFDPGDQVVRARVSFHAEGDTRWYFVDMKPDGASFVGVLPQPLKTIKTIHYYIEVAGKDVAEGRTEEYSPVVAGAGECDRRGVLVAGVLASAKVAVGASTAGAAAAGVPLVPVGFSGAGVVAAGSATGATGVAGAAATGGGSHTGLILGGIGAAGAGVAAAVLAGGGSPTLTGTWKGTQSTTTTWSAGSCPANMLTLTASLTQSGSSLSGSETYFGPVTQARCTNGGGNWEINPGDLFNPNHDSLAITGSVTGGSITWSAPSRFTAFSTLGSGAVCMRVGTLTGNSIAGTVTCSGAGIAAAVANPPDPTAQVTGTWTLTKQ